MPIDSSVMSSVNFANGFLVIKDSTQLRRGSRGAFLDRYHGLPVIVSSSSEPNTADSAYDTSGVEVRYLVGHEHQPTL